MTGSRGTESYTLDALNRLTNVVYPNGDTTAYTYDANGNRLSEVVNGQTTHTYIYDNADQLTNDGTIAYTYDQSGNLLTAGADTYTWDWKNRLQSVTANGATSTYTYDGDDVRISQTTGGATTTYVWDRASGLPLLIDDGTTATLHAGGVQSQIDGTNAATYPLADSLGTIRSITNGTGTVTGTADYAVFGGLRASTGTLSTFGYTGEQRDGTGLTYLRARYYNPSLGRFISADTVQPNAPGTQGYNRYAYVANNPTTWTDPSGHNALAEALEWADPDRFSKLRTVVRGLAGAFSAEALQDVIGLITRAAGVVEVMAVAASLAVLMAASMTMAATSGTVKVFAEQIALASFVIFTLSLVNLYLFSLLPGLARIVSLVFGIQIMIWSAALTYLLGVLVAAALHNWDYFTGDQVATTPPTQTPQNCTRGAFTNLVQDVAISTIFSWDMGAFDLASSVIIGCVTGGGKNDPPKGGCTNSFSAETDIATADGPRDIDDIAVGDEVLAWDESTGVTGSYTVTAVWEHIDPVIVHLTIDGEVIETTPEHPFFTEQRGWVEAGALRVGEDVRDSDGNAGDVQSVAFEHDPQPMYNLTVAEAHTYYVGDGGWLVHNACPPLKLLHSPDTLTSGANYDFWNAKSTDEIVDSLRPGSPYEQLEVKADGTVMQGNTRIYILQQRGYDVDSLPRVLYESPSIDDLQP